MKKRTNPMVIVGMIVVVIAAFVIAFFIKRALPESVGSWSGLIYWLTVAGIDFGGGLLVGKIFGKRR